MKNYEGWEGIDAVDDFIYRFPVESRNVQNVVIV